MEAPKAPKKRSVFRTAWRIFRRSVFTIFILITASVMALQLPIVQTWLAQQLTSYLKKTYDVQVDIGKVNINLFRRSVALTNVLVEDHRNDTIVNAGIIKIDIGNISPDKGVITVSRIVLQNGYFGIHTYKGETLPNLTLFINKLKGKQKEKKKKKAGKAWMIEMKTVVLDECGFEIHNENQPPMNADFQASHINIRGISGKVSQFEVRGDTLEMDVENLQAFDRSGLAMKKFSSHVIISSKELTFSGFKLATYRSNLAGYFSMRYANWQAFSTFNDSIRMIADLDMSNINAADIAFFTDGLKGIDFDFRFKGGVAGTLSNLRGNSFSLYFGRITQMVGDIALTGLPNIDSTTFYFKVKKLTTDAIDLNKIPLPPFGEKKMLITPKEIQRLGIVKYSGELEGSLSNLNITGHAETKIGIADLKMHLFKSGKNAPYQYNGKMDAREFNVGVLINSKQLGKVTFDGTLSGKGFNFKDNSSYMQFDGKVSKLEFNGYSYKGIEAQAKFNQGLFEGYLESADTNAQFTFVGTVDVSDKHVPVYDFNADITRADLVKLNFVKNKKQAVVSTTLNVNMSGKNVDDLIGQARICGTKYIQDGETYTMETLVLNSTKTDSLRVIDIHSDVVNAKFSGQFQFIPLVNEIKKKVHQAAPSLKITPDDKIKYTRQDFYFYIILNHPEILTKIFIPKLKISDRTVIEGRLQSDNNYLSLEINANELAYQKFKATQFFMYVRNKGEKLRIQSDAKNFYLSDSTHIDNLNIVATAIHDSIDVWAGFQNEDSKLNGGSINVLGYIGKAPKYEFNIHDTYFYFNDSLWNINNDNRITLDTSDIFISNLKLRTSGTKKDLVTINGKSSRNPNDTINVKLDDFPLQVINVLLPGEKLKLKGNVEGFVNLHQLRQQPFFTSDLIVEQMMFNDILLGNLGLRSTYDPALQEVTLQSVLGMNGVKIIDIENGKIKLKKDNDGFDIKANIEGLDLSSFSKMAEPVFSDLKGIASGDFGLSGSFNDPQISANLNLKNAGLKLVYLNAYFNLNMGDQKVILSNTSIKFPLINLSDKYGNTGTLKGKISHKLFQNIFMDIRLETNNMCIMETTEKNNEQFYGKAFATGKATIIGPIEDIVVAANMTTNKNTVLNIPINSSKSLKENNFVQFINPNDSISDTLIIEEPKGNFTLDLNVKVTSDATIRIIFDETVGDVITCQGKSDNINLVLNTKGKFNMTGTYEILKGDYLFTLQNIINKKFQIKSGSTVSFTGDPLLAQVNATAIYRANASVYPIIASFLDETAAQDYKRATRVDCELTLTNTLSDLLLGFNLQLPSLDATGANIVRSALSSQEEMNRQVFSLLVLNQFLTPESAGGGGSLNNNAVSIVKGSVGNTSLELLSGQLNNWLSKVTKDVNINLNYRTGSQGTNDQVSVALSTQLFNERVIIDGDVGVGVGNNNTSTTNSNTIVGNVSVEVKITNDGKLRVRAFNRSNDNNVLKSNTYTQGAGISYKVEFDSWADLFKRKKPKKDSVKVDSIPVIKTDSLKLDTIRD